MNFPKGYSADEFWELVHRPENSAKRIELIEGVIYENPLAGFEQGLISGNCLGYVGMHVRQHDLGRVTTAGTGYLIAASPDGKDTILAPDVGFVAKARIPADKLQKYLPLAPDLAVEMVSPNDTAAEIHAKVNKYLQYGARAVWVAYPDTKTVVVHTASGAQTLAEMDTLDGGDVLPGFTLPVRDIFAF